MGTGTGLKRDPYDGILNLKRMLVALCSMSVLVALGCGSVIIPYRTAPAEFSISGSVSKDKRPISHASIQLYELSESSSGTSTVPLLSSPIYTSASGDFTVPPNYKCSSVSDQLYLTATGNRSDTKAAAKNRDTALMALLGECVNPLRQVVLNEDSTIAAASALAPFMSSYSPSGDRIAPPTFNPAPGRYEEPQTVELSAPGRAEVYYTADGSTPSSTVTTNSTSKLYTGAITVSKSATIRAVAILHTVSSVLALGSYVIAEPVSVSLNPPSVPLSASQTQSFTASVANTSNSSVNWSVSPAIGSISSTGLYTAPITIASAESIKVIATSAADSTKSASSTVELNASTAATYYLAANGLDSNDGLSPNTPWLTPNHPGLNCGDTISAAAGWYGAMTITTTPNCSSHNAVWVTCAAFDACHIYTDVWSQGGIDVQASYWAFTGWELTVNSGPYAACFAAVPANGATSSIHDIYFINDIANGCMAGGFVAAQTGPNSVDYFVAIGDIVYNTAQASAYCYSGVSVLHPIATDTLPGTHIYVSQVFAWQNLEPATCNGASSTDGEGIIFDTFNGSDVSYPPYSQQAVIENVIAVYNGAYGVLAGGGFGNSNSPMIVKNATAYGNFTNTNQNQYFCSQMGSFGWPLTNTANANRYTTFTNNLAVTGTTSVSGCGNYTPYAYYFGNVDGTDSFSGNAGYSASGQTMGVTNTANGYVNGSNYTGTNPALANPVEPSAPSCSGKANVVDCMSTVIANFKPTNAAYTSYGYQPPSSPTQDPLFPGWLCGNPNMPSGVVTMGCAN